MKNNKPPKLLNNHKKLTYTGVFFMKSSVRPIKIEMIFCQKRVRRKSKYTIQDVIEFIQDQVHHSLPRQLH